MKIKELKKLLEEYDENLEVCISIPFQKDALPLASLHCVVWYSNCRGSFTGNFEHTGEYWNTPRHKADTLMLKGGWD